MKRKIIIKKLAYSLAVAGLATHIYTNAAPLNFATYPAGSASIEPAPNVIISVDDSGSMGASGISALKTALKDTFAASNIPDKRLRIAWQSMNRCNGIPSNSTSCGSRNSMKILEGTHRSNFLTWVDTLTAKGGTPSHQMVRNAGDYLKNTPLNRDSPWAEVPGTRLGNVLSCRKSFHIFMTDGGWNSSTSSTTTNIDGDRDLTGYKTISPGNIDGTNATFPDKKSYVASSTQTKIYSDLWGSTSQTCSNRTSCSTDGINTLADLSFYYWATDLRDDIPNKVKPIIKKSGSEIFKNSRNQNIEIEEYWNPKNNPATWQSLTTYTIGFNDAATWTGTPIWGGDTYSGDYSKLITGDLSWPSPLCKSDNTPSDNGTFSCDGVYNKTTSGYNANENNRKKELWHMAINGRGKFIPATTSDDLKNAFKDIVSNIIEDTSQPLTGYASSSSSISTQDAKLYTATYEANGWKGAIYSQIAATDTGVLSANSAWGNNINNRLPTTADKLDARTGQIASRLVLTTNGSSGISFNYANLSNAQKSSLTTSLGTNATTADKTSLGTAIADFIRGDITNNGGTVQNFNFRTRNSIQGDIVNSAIWYTGSPSQGYNQSGYSAFAARYKTRIPMLYVGGNDGMLHGFSAIDGQEKISYIPEGIISRLPQLANSSYTHQYYVDGSAFTGDIVVNSTSSDLADRWRTMLVGSLGAGGKGYFVLDVTQPGSTVNNGYASNFSTANAESIVILDKTATTDADIGYIFSTPVVSDYNAQISTQIVKMNNDRWAVVMGNGINSTNERPVLLVQYLDGQKELVKITAASSGTNASSNGLSAPRLVDLNGDGTPDIIYAGDLRGNLWKFDLSSSNPQNWGIAFSGQPLFTASHTANNATTLQPITTAPLVRVSESTAGLMVAFGTGINVTEGDRTDTSVQSFYSVVDNTRYKLCAADQTSCTVGKVIIDTNAATPTVVVKSNLVARTFSNTATAGTGNSQGQNFWAMGTQSELNYQNSKGWYFNFPETGERVLRNPKFYSATSNIIDILSDVPASGGNIEGETCEPTSTPAKAWRSLLGIEFGLKPTQQLLDTNGDGLYNSADSGTNRTTSSPREISLSTRAGKINIGTQQTTNTGKLINPVTSLNWRQLQ